MYIKSVTPEIKDVFLGIGWDKWIRINIETKQVMQSNVKVAPAVLKNIFQKVHK